MGQIAERPSPSSALARGPCAWAEITRSSSASSGTRRRARTSRPRASRRTCRRLGQYVGERYYHGSPFRRAFEEGLLDPSQSLLAGMRGSLYGPDDVAMPDELGFEVIACEELVASATRSTARASGDEWARDRCSCRSTSTCSTRRSHPERVLRRPVVSRRVRRSDSCGRFAASASRVRRRRGEPAVRRARCAKPAVAAANVAYELLTLDVLA